MKKGEEGRGEGDVIQVVRVTEEAALGMGENGKKN